MINLILPWPSHDLSPNSRAKWKRIKAVTAARDEAYLLAIQAGLKMRPGTVRMCLTFNPPNRRRYDLDGLGSREKAQGFISY
jgi:crossover junction endodeoxyribonuclease RusA